MNKEFNIIKKALELLRPIVYAIVFRKALDKLVYKKKKDSFSKYGGEVDATVINPFLNIC